MIRKIYDYLNKAVFPSEDKLKHMLVGDYIASLTIFFITVLVILFNISLWFYCLLPIPSFIIGYLKEHFDRKYSLGYYEKMDLYYTMKMSIQYAMVIASILLLTLIFKK